MRICISFVHWHLVVPICLAHIARDAHTFLQKQAVAVLPMGISVVCGYLVVTIHY